MDKDRILDLFRETNAMLEGHFVLSSGKHSDRYFQCALLLEHPRKAEALAVEFARRVRAVHTTPYDVVIGPALGAVTWAYEVARALGARAQFTERKGDVMELRRGFALKPSDRVLVVEDVMTTGGSAREVIELLARLGVRPLAAGCIVNRSGGNPFERDGLPLFALAEVDAVAWEPAACPLCKAGSQAVKPGSRPGA
ncbi:MAG: orotate phosphoribosyltransferase [Planctomycetes bacterium]|nr:orotate phosphoribosyltransferase [Planctomycetota bacterium]